MAGSNHVPDPTNQPSFRFSLKMLLLAFLLLAPILWLYATVAKAKAKHEAEIAERTKTIWTMLAESAAAAEQIRISQGRAPKDLAEIEALVGHALSVSITPKHSREIEYEQTSPTNYKLLFFCEWVEGFSGDYLLFDSANPKAGWVPVYD